MYDCEGPEVTWIDCPAEVDWEGNAIEDCTVVEDPLGGIQSSSHDGLRFVVD